MKILLVRHGYDDFETNEKSMGRGQMIMAADVMKSLKLVDKDVRIITSLHKRTMASAQIIADELELPSVEEVSWLTDGTNEDSYKELMAYTKLYNHGTVIIALTHLPEIEKILGYLQREYGVEIDTDVGYGDVYIIETDKRTVRKMEIL